MAEKKKRKDEEPKVKESIKKLKGRYRSLILILTSGTGKRKRLLLLHVKS